MDFYDEIAEQYDQVTGAAGRRERAEGFVRELAARQQTRGQPIRAALDVACGNGLYAILLAQMGARAVGADISLAMLDQARRSAQAQGAHVEWVLAAMQDLAWALPPGERGPFDAVLCMGNSIPHLMSDAELDLAIGGFLERLNEGGIVVLQLLNYARVPARQERIVGITRHGDKEYVRFYDFLPGHLRFNILEIDWSGPSPSHRLHSTELRPYTAADLRQALTRHGCGSGELFGNLEFTPFDEDRDETVMLVGRRHPAPGIGH